MLAQPSALASARLSGKLYMPTALIKEHLPAGLGDLQTVPRLQEQTGKTEAARLEQYIHAIRATAKVFSTYNHKNETLKRDESYMIWIDSWAQLSGFGRFICMHESVSYQSGMHAQAIGDRCVLA